MTNKLIIIKFLLIGINFSMHSQINKTDLNCVNGRMGFIKINTHFQTQKIEIKNNRKEFYIDVDTTKKSKNFISYTEHFFRDKSIKLDTSNVGYIEDWDNYNSKQKLEIVELKKEKLKQLAEKVHIETNQEQQIISLVNPTNKNLLIPSIDKIPAIVLQAQDSNKEWKTIRYIHFSNCGNSYSYSKIPKKSILNIIVKLPENGNVKTKMRLKIFYNNSFIYSNEFDYKISNCDFFELGQIGKECINCYGDDYSKLKIKPTHW